MPSEVQDDDLMDDESARLTKRLLLEKRYQLLLLSNQAHRLAAKARHHIDGETIG